jgi:hypothetical protein
MTYTAPMPARVFASLLLVGLVAAADGPPIEVDGFSGAVAAANDGELAPGVISERWWKREEPGVTERIAEIRLKKPAAPTAWLARWRTVHGCTAAVTKRIAPIARLNAPQLTFGGQCKGGDSYVTHIVQLENVIVELHVDAPVFQTQPRRLEEAMRSLLSRVHPPRIATPQKSR